MPCLFLVVGLYQTLLTVFVGVVSLHYEQTNKMPQLPQILGYRILSAFVGVVPLRYCEGNGVSQLPHMQNLTYCCYTAALVCIYTIYCIYLMTVVGL